MSNAQNKQTRIEQLIKQNHGHAICYSGYREGQDPRQGIFPSYEEIKEDLLILEKNWSFLRLYDCSQHAETTLKVIRDEGFDFKVMVATEMAAEMSNPNCPWGGDYSDEILAANRQLNSDNVERVIALTNQYSDIVFAVSVGNEASVEWTDHLVSVESLVEYTRRIKASVAQPVTFCENYVPWTTKLAPLVAELDFLSVHTYPVWEYRTIDDALAYSQQNYYSVANHYPDKPVVITEAGWPTASNGRGIDPNNASEELQAAYYKQLMAWTTAEKILTFVFEAFDEPWKGSPDPQEPEKHWGLFFVDRTPKLVMRHIEEKMETKIEDLLKQLTLAEKASMLAGANMWYSMPIERLGIPSMQVSDGPNGVRGADDNIGDTSICFPVGVAMGATWNPELIEAVGSSLAAEVRRKGAHVLLAPTVNIHRTPIAGRNFECFAEDPYLSGIIAAAYINGLQKQGVSGCIKHFVANDQEFERFSISSEVAERPLHEIYLEPFRIAMEKANPWTIMSSYNRINGTFASENDVILRDILKEKWEYDGLVISDWYGTYSDAVPAGGLDLEMPGPARWMNPEKIIAAVEAGDLDEAVIDDKVRRLLRTLDRVGLMETALPPVVAPDPDLPRAVAAEAIVLLKNDDDVLPIATDKPQTIAVIGENAHWAQIMGGGSSQVNPHRAVSPLAGIQERAGEQATIAYEIGTLVHRMPQLLDVTWLKAVDGSAGLTLSYYPNRELAGDASHTHVSNKSEVSWFGTVNPYVDLANFSLRLEGTLTAPTAGKHQFHLWSIGRSRLLIDGDVVIDHMEGDDLDRHTIVPIELSPDKPVSILVEYITEPSNAWRTLRVGCIPPIAEDSIQAAVDAAAQADVAIVVAGLMREWESEGFDRVDMKLAGRQDELISRVAAVNPRTVVVLNAGSPLEMPWIDEVTAVLQQWYGGQDAGHALADVLFGDVNPSAKLPTTFPVRLEDNPAYINYPGESGQVHYGEGIFVGYRYYDKKAIAPLFPFGHGLSYTTFAYSNLQLNGETFSGEDQVLVNVDVTNTGDRAGQEVVQLYVRDEESKVVRPLQELKAFAKVALAAGETKTVTLALNRQSLAFYETAVSDWTVESGKFSLFIGSSSRDIRLQGAFEWTGEAETAPPSGPHQFSTVAT